MNVIVIGFLFGLMLLMALACINAEKILDSLSEPPKERHEESHERKKGIFEQWKDSKYETGTKKIQELKNRLGNLAMTDDRPAVWRICRSLVESLDEINNEFCEERTKLQLEVEALKESAKSLEQKYNEASVEAMKIRVDSDQKLREAQEKCNEWKRKYLGTEKFQTALCDGRDADGKIVSYIGTKMVTLQMPYDVYTEQKSKFESQAKEIEELKKQLEIERPVEKFGGLGKYEVHAWKEDSLWKIYRYAPSQEALYEQLRRDGYYRIDYTQKIEG